MATPGTLALIFLVWSSASQPGSPPNYSRSVLTPPEPGESTEFLDPNAPMHDFYDAKARLEGGNEVSGEVGPLAGRAAFATLPAKTLAECRAYLKSHYRFYEEAAESAGHVIQDARCMVIPPGKHLSPYFPGGYGLDGKPQDPFGLVDIPAAPKQEGPACAQITRPDWPQEAATSGVEGHADTECQVYQGDDGYRHNRNCKVVSKHDEMFSNLYAEAALDFESERCWKGDPAPTSDGQPHLEHHNFTFND
ncbi:hypothetical protein J3T99_05580 [Acetobacteraceae bacterium B3987]|nr:hypothetical protein [Acetobacteraceae bacterium B3987]